MIEKINQRKSITERGSIAFFVFRALRFPRNNREYYLTRELQRRGWNVVWLLPRSGKNEGVPVDELILHYNDLDFRGRTYLLPIYIGCLLRGRKIRFLWLSGWAMRCDREIYWLVKILRFMGIKTLYDPIDPKCEFETASKELIDLAALRKCYQRINRIYRKCARVLCVTPEIKSLMIRHGADKAKLFVARWGTDLNVFNRNNLKYDFRRLHSIDDATVLLGWMGSMIGFKGLMEMFLPLAEKMIKNKKIHFIIAGDGPLFNDIKQWAVARNYQSITLLGRLLYEDAAVFTASLDAYVVTTAPDTEYARAICPIKCYDAIATGTPLVTTRTPATEHLLELSSNVYLCDYNIDSFEQAVSFIIQNISTLREGKTRNPAKVISHQMISRDIADMLDTL